jgi:Uma2 family endonuclease
LFAHAVARLGLPRSKFPLTYFYLLPKLVLLEIRLKSIASAGIAEYWVMDLQKVELVVFRDLSNDVYQSETHLNNGTICSIAFPDLEVDIKRLFD